jgi:tetratricopeptide (TPR) repeat protein
MLRAIMIFSLVLVGVGCETPKHVRDAHRGLTAYRGGDYASASRAFAPLADRTDENYVLNNLRFGSAALAGQNFRDAERGYLRAYEILNATRVNDAGRSVGATVFNERLRVWRGEPFERAVANLHLGLLYYAQRDYGNARGAFENALFKLRDYSRDDRDSSYSEQESDFAIALLMLGRTWRHLGRDDLAGQHFSRLASLRPDAKDSIKPASDLKRNVMIYVDYGFSPRKVADGMDGAELGFYPRPGQAGSMPTPRVIVNGVAVSDTTPALFDTVAMAGDRRWQQIDTIRATKSLLGTGLVVAGAGTTIYGANRDDEGAALAGVGMMIAGALLKASSGADTRTWEMCPRAGFVAPIYLPPGTHDITIDAGAVSQTWRGVVVRSDAETFVWAKLGGSSTDRQWFDASQSVTVEPPSADEKR